MKVLIAGDYCPVGRVNSLIEKDDVAEVFSDVKTVIQRVDYSIVNFECPVCDEGVRPIEKHGPNLRCTTKGVESIKWAGFNCLTLANNHFRDYGDDGVKNTIDACKAIGIDTVGGGKDLHEASVILYKNIGEHILAVINCCEHEFSIALETQGGSNPLNPVQQYYAIQEAREKADYVLVIVHGGHEHFQLPSPRMVETYRFFVDAGADAVVNHHQHCYSGYEIYNGKPIFYGLGNFCFDNEDYREGNWTEGFCVTIEFAGNEVNYALHPYIQCAKEPKVAMLPEHAFDKRLKSLNAIISDPTLLKESVEEYYEESAKYYGNIFEPVYNRYYLAARYKGIIPSFISKRRLLASSNFIMCEAHRDKLTWWLNNNK